MDIVEPTLILDETRCRNNISFMVSKARELQLLLRPHFKTHQSLAIGRWFREAGVRSITVSSVRMAQYFARDGWDDITIAIPFNIRETTRLNELAKQAQVQIIVLYPFMIDHLDAVLDNEVGFLIEIDNGYHRTGIHPQARDRIEEILEKEKTASHLSFRGFLTHAGNTYQAASEKEINCIHLQTTSIMKNLKAEFLGRYPDIIISLGDTPSCSLMHDFNGIDEIRPGNFVFYDLMQKQLGVCREEDIAVCLACPVISRDEEKRKIVVYGGAIHLSREYLDSRNGKIYGKVVLLEEQGWSESLEGTEVTGLSQEHGIIRMDNTAFNRIRIGDLIGILPVHSCLTANLMSSYLTLSGTRIDHLNSTK